MLDTINLSQNVTISGIPISPEMVLAGRELRDPTSTDIDAAMFLVLTYYFPDKDCLGNAGHFQWLRVLEEAAGHTGDLVVQAQSPRLIALEYDKTLSTRSRFSILSVFCYAAYAAFLVYCVRSMRGMKTVHSRFGLAVTGLVEIVVSTITSLSVCALVGFRITMVPWELFPIIVLFIGVENMFHIVDAVLKTSVTLPVKERIAQGLSRAGTSNTLKVVSYNTILGVIAFFSTGAIRQFCAFAVVVLVAHWFLVHTFFVTVLSIDIQRLELDELLRQNSNLAPASGTHTRSSNAIQPKTQWGKAVAAIQSLLRGRFAKNISLFLLLAITATLYYATSPYPVGHKTNTKMLSPTRFSGQGRRITATDRITPAFRIWQTLNPVDDSLVHVRIESPAILVLAPEDDDRFSHKPAADNEKMYRPRLSRLGRVWTRMARPVTWLVKIIVVPITATTVMLYALLLYLLKNVELLEAQRQHPEPEPPSTDEPSSVDVPVSFTTLPRAFSTDVELIAANRNGRVIATVGLQNEFVIWRRDTQTSITVDTSGILLGSSSTPLASMALTAIAVNDTGTVCAAGTSSGIISTWWIGKDQVKPLQLLLFDDTSSAISQLHFAFSYRLHSHSQSPSPLRPSTPSPSLADNHGTETVPCLYAAHESGRIVKWDVFPSANPSLIKPSRSASVVKSVLLPVQGDERLLIAFSLEDGTLELCDVARSDQLLSRDCCISAGNPVDLVCKVDVCNVELDGSRHLIIGAATQAGVVSLWDGGTRECLSILDEPFGDVNHLRLSPVHTSTCSICGELPAETFSVSFSVGQVIMFYRAYLSLPVRRCSCPRNQPQQSLHSSPLGHRSRSGSVASLTSSTGAMTPVHSRSRMSSFSTSASSLNASMFPVSAHGVHSRRASEKDAIRRTHDTSFINSSDVDDAESHPVGPQDVTLSQAPLWQSFILVRVADAMFERGCWDVVDDKIVGVRRKPRPPFIKGKVDPKVQVKATSSYGLSSSALERWELWTFDPTDSRLQASPLDVLNKDLDQGITNKRKLDDYFTGPGLNRTTASSHNRRRSDLLIPRLHFTRVSPIMCSSRFCLAGFGNTVGLFNFNMDLSISRRPSMEVLRPKSRAE
ncbi:hypothetical protein AcW1_005297 [Taiwanofungus camphoratus]|nr:hypothetical protein AcW2_004067 [Antrodia cinnamomea]KAI0933480.1 hypothetical protein AcV5_005616 [Antrodia cinnamomea]KAI0948722.1 hypothetical protein AcV7_009385 [Antrodia cinnamomea]KAI0956674.1 hypothetical protein AcW1_005297 [Antrodia cinnamomea]